MADITLVKVRCISDRKPWAPVHDPHNPRHSPSSEEYSLSQVPTRALLDDEEVLTDSATAKHLQKNKLAVILG